uniref:EF-hand domain-containing protein n=1 Tax=Angiostrongylus cantonensis TaxID=6313 RepID=A0A158P794_ANGCA
MEGIEEVFQFHDTKGDSKIAASQIGNCLRSLNLQPTQELIERMTSQWKDQPETRISIEEFMPIYQNVKKESGKPATFEQFQSLLSHYDREGSGNVKLHDLRHMLQNLGEKMSADEVDILLGNLEITDGKVSINELIRMIML